MNKFVKSFCYVIFSLANASCLNVGTNNSDQSIQASSPGSSSSDEEELAGTNEPEIESEAQEEDDIALPVNITGAFLTGQITDIDGKKIEGATVYVRGDPDLQATTKENGVFTVEYSAKAKKFDSENFSIVATFETNEVSFAAISPEFPVSKIKASNQEGLSLLDLGRLDLSVVIKPTGSVYGSISTEAFGNSSKTVTISIPGTHFKVTIDKSSPTFNFQNLPEGNWEFVVETPQEEQNEPNNPPPATDTLILSVKSEQKIEVGTIKRTSSGGLITQNPTLEHTEESSNSPEVENYVNLVLTPSGSQNFVITDANSPGTPVLFSVKNEGNTASDTLDPPVISGVNSANFTVSSDSCSNNRLEPSAICTFKLSFQASSDGPYNATVKIIDASGIFSESVTLSGNASGFKPPKWSTKSSWVGSNYIVANSIGYIPRVLQLSSAANHEPILSSMDYGNTEFKNYKISPEGVVNSLDNIDLGADITQGAQYRTEMTSSGDLHLIGFISFAGSKIVGFRLNPANSSGTQVGARTLIDTSDNHKEKVSLTKLEDDIVAVYKSVLGASINRVVSAVRLKNDPGGSNNNFKIYKLDGTTEKTNSATRPDSLLESSNMDWMDSPQVAFSPIHGLFTISEYHSNYGFNGNVAGKLASLGAIDGGDADTEVDGLTELANSFSGGGVSNKSNSNGLKPIKLHYDPLTQGFISISFKWNNDTTPQPVYITKNSDTGWVSLDGNNPANPVPGMDYAGDAKGLPIGVCGDSSDLLVGYAQVDQSGSSQQSDDIIVKHFNGTSWSTFFQATTDVGGGSIDVNGTNSYAMDMVEFEGKCYLTWTNGVNIYGAYFEKQ